MSTAADLVGPWFRRYRRSARPRLTLICFPHAGGAATLFRHWPALLPTDIELVAVRYPGRQDRFAEPCIESMAQMVDQVTPALLPLLDRPIAVFGHSMGAAIAHEVTARLETTQAAKPALLFVSGRAAGPFVATTAAHANGDDALIAAVRRLDRTHSGLFDNAELRSLLLPSLRADYRLIETYDPVPGPVVDTPIVAYTGDSDPVCDVHRAQGWAAYTRASFSLKSFAGDHFFLQPNAAGLVADLAHRLDFVENGSSAGPAS